MRILFSRIQDIYVEREEKKDADDLCFQYFYSLISSGRSPSTRVTKLLEVEHSLLKEYNLLSVIETTMHELIRPINYQLFRYFWKLSFFLFSIQIVWKNTS